jgi:hypothetical protein
MTAALAFLYISAISFVGAFLFAAVDRLEPSPRLVLIFKCAILASGAAANVRARWREQTNIKPTTQRVMYLFGAISASW